MRKTASLYVLKEMVPVFLIGLMTFTVILLMDKILKLIEMIVSRGVSLSQILMLLMFISPSFLIFTIPTAVLLGTLVSFGRLSGDSEIIAFKASGMSLYQLYLPVAIFSVVAYLITTFLVLYGLPWGNRGFKATLYLIAQSKADIEIKERVFNDVFEGIVLYVNKVPIRGKKMEGILIYDDRDKSKVSTIFGKEGFLVNNPGSQELILRLVDGDIHQSEQKNNVFRKVQFNTYDLKLEVAKALTALKKKIEEHEMSVDELRVKIGKMKQLGLNTAPQEVELHKRYAIPFACIIFGLMGVPLGIQPRRSGRSHGFVFSILILLAYYISLSAAEIFAVRGAIPPLVAAWVPNLLFTAFGGYLLVKAAKERPFRPALVLNEALDAIQRKWRKVTGNV